MRELPIPFSAPMVLALLDGRKIQTRRLLKPTEGERLLCRTCGVTEREYKAGDCVCATGEGLAWTACEAPRYRVGDYLYVREGIERWISGGNTSGAAYVRFKADGNATFRDWPATWKRFSAVPMHMPKELSRITLEVTGVKVERLQEISRESAIAEGMSGAPDNDSVCDFSELWDSLNAARASWESNPWVAAYTFTVHKTNIANLTT